jgi:hypothetical protein
MGGGNDERGTNIKPNLKMDGFSSNTGLLLL